MGTENRVLRDLITPDSRDFTDFLPGFENLSTRERRELGRISEPFTGDVLQNALNREQEAIAKHGTK